jgi:hypothetical protein
VVAVVLLVAAGLVARGLDLRALLEQGLFLIRSAGPVVFFTAMALLPSCGVPMLAFTLSVVSLFASRLGTVPVLLLALAAMTVNMVLTYGLARRGAATVAGPAGRAAGLPPASGRGG